MPIQLLKATMPRHLRVQSCAVLIGLCNFVSPASSALAPEDIASLEAGAAVVRVTKAASPADGAVFAAIDIPVAPAAVWRVLTDCKGAPEFLPNLESCAILERHSGTSDIREHRIVWASFMPRLRSVFRSTYKENESIAFSRAGGDLEHLEGEWRLTPIAGGKATRLVYDTRVGFHALVPAFIIRDALLKDIPQFLTTIRAEALRRTAS